MSTLELRTLPHLTRDLRDAAKTMGVGEARTLVDLYYQLQDFRIQAGNQNRALTKSEEPHATIAHFNGQFFQLERDIAKALDTYSASQPLGSWAREHVGVGPVIAAGMLAHIDITKTPYASSLWKFAGLAPDQRYVKGEKRTWNANLKVLCWKLGDSFVKQSGHENCYYGHLYRQRKEYETVRNDSVVLVKRISPPINGLKINGNEDWTAIEGQVFQGGNAKAALKTLGEKTIRDVGLRATLMSGKLPDGQLDMRARRYAVKRFLVHYYECAWWLNYGTPPPNPYAQEHMGHQHIDPSPVPYPKAA